MRRYHPLMHTKSSLVSDLAIALRAARKARGLSVVALAEQGGVSPRLVSEFEQGRRSHVSLETALRLLQLVDVPLTIAGTSSMVSEEVARAERAARRRSTWVGAQTTLSGQAAPQAPASYAARLLAVAQASRLAVNLQTAHRQQLVRADVEQAVVKRPAISRHSL